MQDAFYDEFGLNESTSTLGRIRGAYIKWGGALLSLMVLGLLVFWAYRLGIRDPREIPVIRAMDVPMRVQPEDPGGTRMANQGLEVNEILAGNEAQQPERVTLAPAAETPPVEETLTEAEKLRSIILQPDAEPQPETQPGPTVQAEQDDQAEQTPPADEPLPQVAAESPADVPITEDESRQEDPADLVAALVEQAVSAPEPESEPAAAALVRPQLRPRDFSPVAAASPAPSAGTGAASTGGGDNAAPDLPSGTRLVQLGAFESEAQAAGQWFRLQRAHEDLLGARENFIQRAVSNGRVFYRLRVMGFAAQEDQRAMCDALQARGAECIPVTVR